MVNNGRKVDIQPANKKHAAVVPCAAFSSWFCFVLWFFVSYGNQPFQNNTLLVLWSQILSFTSDPRQDGQSSRFATSSSQKVCGNE